MTVHELIALLQGAQLHFTMQTHRENAVMFCVAVPGERWEIEVFPDGQVDLECFRSDGTIKDQADLLALIEQYKD